MMNYEENNLPEFVNVVKMAEMLNLSRSRFYQLIDEKVFLKPVQIVNSKRPVFTQEMIKRNLDVKYNNVGINGKIVMFYSARNKLPWLIIVERFSKLQHWPAPLVLPAESCLALWVQTRYPGLYAVPESASLPTHSGGLMALKKRMASKGVSTKQQPWDLMGWKFFIYR